jgi:hypothetical protein
MFLTFAHVALYLLGESKHLTRFLLCQAEDDGIHEAVIGLEAPRLRFDKGRLANHLAYPLAYQANGLSQVPFTVTEIGTQTEI